MKKHLKCLGLFLAICAGLAVLVAVAGTLALFIIAVIGPDLMLALLILILLFCIAMIIHEFCKDWR